MILWNILFKIFEVLGIFDFKAYIDHT